MDESENLAESIAMTRDACVVCSDLAHRKRRLSTSSPSFNICRLGCGKKVYETQYSCIDCSNENNTCPWCGSKPWKKKDPDENAAGGVSPVSREEPQLSGL
jgi:hypothetical protein